MITLYGYPSSGHSDKVRLLLQQLGRDYAWVDVDSPHGATRTPAFLAINPSGKVPVLQGDDGRILVESNAMLVWLSEGTRFLPLDAWPRAQAMSWLFFEQYSHEPCIAVARFIRGWTPLDSGRRAELPALQARGHDALRVMEHHLQTQVWFTGDAYGIADIAPGAYPWSPAMAVSTCRRIPRCATGWRGSRRRPTTRRCRRPHRTSSRVSRRATDSLLDVRTQ